MWFLAYCSWERTTGLGNEESTLLWINLTSFSFRIFFPLQAGKMHLSPACLLPAHTFFFFLLPLHLSLLFFDTFSHGVYVLGEKEGEHHVRSLLCNLLDCWRILQHPASYTWRLFMGCLCFWLTPSQYTDHREFREDVWKCICLGSSDNRPWVALEVFLSPPPSLSRKIAISWKLYSVHRHAHLRYLLHREEALSVWGLFARTMDLWTGWVDNKVVQAHAGTVYRMEQEKSSSSAYEMPLVWQRKGWTLYSGTYG